MSSLFADAWAEASGEISDQFGRLWTLIPKKKAADPNAPPVDDPDRQQVDFVAAFHEPSAKPLIVNAYDPRTSMRPGTSAEKPMLRIQPDQIRNLQLVIRGDDEVQNKDKGTLLRISSARTTANGVRECVVNWVGDPT